MNIDQYLQIHNNKKVNKKLENYFFLNYKLMNLLYE